MSDATLADRAWYAWHALERDEEGRPPAQTPLEDQHGLSRGTLGKVFRGQRRQPRPPTLAKLAAALRVTEAWLLTGHGEAPRLTGPIFVRPGSAEADAVAEGEWSPETHRSAWTPEAMRSFTAGLQVARVKRVGDLPYRAFDAYLAKRAEQGAPVPAEVRARLWRDLAIHGGDAGDTEAARLVVLTYERHFEADR